MLLIKKTFIGIVTFVIIVLTQNVYSGCNNNGEEDPGEQCDNGIFNGTRINNPENCNTSCESCDFINFDLAATKALMGNNVNKELGGNYTYPHGDKCLPLGGYGLYGTDNNSQYCPSFTSWNFLGDFNYGTCKNGKVDISYQDYCCGCQSTKLINVDYFYSSEPTYCCGNEWKNKDGTCGPTTTGPYSYRKCGSGPSWYNYGSPSDSNGSKTSCSTLTTLGSAYAIGDFVCRDSQPSNSICDKSCTQTVDCDGVCGGTATDYNGATAGCGTAPTAKSCSNMPTNAEACNTATPSSNASYSLVENCSSPDVACQAKCAGGTTYNGGVCVNSLKAYQCGSDGDWSQPPVSCAQQTSYVNTADYYTAGQSVCLLLSDTAPTNNTCANPTSDVKCGVTPGTCDLGSYVNGSDNGSLACNTTRQWQCRNAANTTTLSCNKTNYCNYACNGSSCEATIAGTYSSPSCDSACVVVDPPRCGDGIVQTNRGEECDGTAGLTAGQSCNASCQKTCTTSYKCIGADGRQGNVNDRCVVDGTTQYNPGYCCVGNEPNATRTPSGVAGANPRNYRCSANVLVWDVDSATCGQASETVTKDCTNDPRGRGNGTEYICSAVAKDCVPKTSLKVEAWFCLLTGANNTLNNCTVSLPIAQPVGRRYTEPTTVDNYTPPTPGGTSWEYTRSLQKNFTANLYNAAGGLIVANMGLSNTTYGNAVQFSDSYIQPNTTYHVSVGNIPAGWVLLTGGSAINQNWRPATPYAGKNRDSQNLSSSRGITFTGSTIIPSGLRINFASEAIGTAYFYYYCPSGTCATAKKLHVNTVFDRNNDGFSSSQFSDDESLKGVLVEVYTASGAFYASGYTKSVVGVNNSTIGYWPSLGARLGIDPQYNGTVSFDVSSSQTYQVRITVPNGYTVPSSGPYHQIQQDIKVVEQAYSDGTSRSADWNGNSVNGETLDFGAGGGGQNAVFTYSSATGYTVTIPSNDNVYARTRFIGSRYDTALSASIVSPQTKYAPGSTMQVRYQLKNVGYSTYNPDVEISIMTGLVPTGPAVFSGTCPVFSSNGGLYYGYYASDNDDTSFGSYRTTCDYGNSYNGTVGRCHSKYAEGMFITYNNNSSINNSYYTYADRYPINNSTGDLFLYLRQDGSGQPSRLRPKGRGIFLNTDNDNLTGGFTAGSICDITINYIVSGGILDTTYRSRACSIPQDDNTASPATDELDRVPQVISDNCSNIDYTIGLPSCVVPASLGGGTINDGSGVVARYQSTVPGDTTSRCQSEYRQCIGGVLSGSYTNQTCIKQCQQTWASGSTVQINPGSTVVAQQTPVATKAQGCACRTTQLTCNAVTITNGIFADPGGRPYQGGYMSGLAGYDYPVSMGCYLASECTCSERQVDLYQVHYTMSGNTVLGNNRVVDQVHSNVCLIPSSFTGRLANNEVRITFYSGASVTATTGTALFGPVSGSTLAASSWTGLICGPYVEYEFAKPLYPGAEGYFFYQFKLLKSVSEDPSVATGDNCVWIYRETNNDFFTNTAFSNSSVVDPGDPAQRFANAALFSTIKFAPKSNGQLNNNNYVCVPPPTSICPANTIQQKTQIPVNLCGNGVQELNEQCDDGHAPIKIGGTNNDDGSILYSTLAYDDPLYNNYCKKDCTLGKPLVCNWTASCSNSNISSIQEGEQFPFWWNFGDTSLAGSGFTNACSTAADANKIMLTGYPQPTCSFELKNFYNDGVNSGSVVLYSFSAPCIGTGIGNLPMFMTGSNGWERESSTVSILSTEQGKTVKTANNDSLLSSIRDYTLNRMVPQISKSQGSKLIDLTGSITKGRLGEYEVRLTKIDYRYCNQNTVLTRQSDGSITTSYTYDVQTGTESAINGFCSNKFMVTKPYIIQEGSLLSTLDVSDFSNFYTSATRLLDQTIEGTYSSDVLSRTTKIPTYVSTIGVNGTKNNEFVGKFIDKYVALATSAGSSFSYSHGFRDLSSAGAKIYPLLYKVPTRDIFVYTGTSPLFLSDYAFDNSSNVGSLQNANPLTIISQNADVVIFGDMIKKNIMVITDKNLIFAGGSISSQAQKVTGIFVSNGYDGSVLKNDNQNYKWIDDGRLVVNGIVIGPNINDLSNRRRSVIDGWFTDGSVTDSVIAKRKKSLIEGASLLIKPNPQLFTSPPPGSDELFKALSVGK